MIRGLVIGGFTGRGVDLDRGTRNTLECNFIGTNLSGTALNSNTVGHYIGTSHSNTIGGSTVAQRNLLTECLGIWPDEDRRAAAAGDD